MRSSRNSKLFVLAGAALAIVLCAGSVRRNKEADRQLLEALHDADARKARSLLLKGADANVKDEDGLTALMYAAMYTGSDCIKLLLAKGADPNARTNSDITALMLAVKDAAKVRLLLLKGAEVNAKSKQGHTALSIAAAGGASADVVRILLDHGADLSVGNLLGAAARTGDVQLVKYLLQRGADPNDKTNLAGAGTVTASAKRISELARTVGGPPIFPFGGLVGNIKATPLMYAAMARNLAVIKLLLSNGADVNARNARKSTALMYAAQMGDAATVRLLLENGAEVNAVNELGYTSLMFAAAAESDDPELIYLLLAGRAEVNHKGENGETALTHAERKGKSEIVHLLKKAGAKA